MVRKSEDKQVKDESKYKDLLPQYFNVLEVLNTDYKTTEDTAFADLVNFKKNAEVPKHSWFEYKQGYSERLVKELILSENPSKNLYVLDPFTGVGTTNLVAQSLGYKSIGFDINPVATFAAKVKTTVFTKQEIKYIENTIASFSPHRKSKDIPISPLLERSFTKATFDKLMNIKGFYESLQDERVRSFFKLAYLAIIEGSSNRVKDGNGIKIAKNKKMVKDIYQFYLLRCKTMLSDVYKLNVGQEPIIINGSIILDDHIKRIKSKKIGMVVFSPPYANCFDYCEVYKLELWMGGFVKSYADFRKYRSMALRSHVNSAFNHNIKNVNRMVTIFSEMISCFNIWNKNIPDMIQGYFDDMTEIFKILQLLMVRGAKCFVVVANSGYKGILIPTDLMFGDIASRYGFRVLKIIFARKIRASSQQMRDLHNSYDNLMRESIVALEKK